MMMRNYKGGEMADFNKILTPGDWENGEVNVVIEIGAGSNNKVEWNRKLATFELDRVEPDNFPKPTNYGFIPQTLDEDGDELDVLLITDHPLSTGVFLKARVLGVMKFSDDGEVDDKIIAVPADDRNNGDAYKTLEDLPKRLLEKVEHHFNHYKDLYKPGSTEVKSFEGLEAAKVVIGEAIERWNKQ
jgi:inorganic pyrophosphatase